MHDPTTCCTFTLMEHFHLTTLQSKTSAHDYYATLCKLTDNTGITTTYVRHTVPGYTDMLINN